MLEAEHHVNIMEMNICHVYDGKDCEIFFVMLYFILRKKQSFLDQSIITLHTGKSIKHYIPTDFSRSDDAMVTFFTGSAIENIL